MWWKRTCKILTISTGRVWKIVIESVDFMAQFELEFDRVDNTVFKFVPEDGSQRFFNVFYLILIKWL